MKKNALKKMLFAAYFMVATTLTSKAQYFDWLRTLGSTGQDMGQSIAVDALGNVYTTGYFEDSITFYPTANGSINFVSKGLKDIFITKVSPTGTLLWSKHIGGIGDDAGTSITVSADGHVYVLTTFSDTVDYNVGSSVILNGDAGGLRDIAICKYDLAGTLVWVKQVAGAGDDQGRRIRIDKQGNLVFTGIFYATPDFDPATGTIFNLSSNGWGDIFTCKWSAAGAFIWANATGGIDSDEAYGLGIDSASNVYVTGRFQRATDFDPGAGVFPLSPIGLLDGFLVKYNASGAFSWAKQIACNASVDSSIVTGNDIIIDKAGNLTLLGRFRRKVDFDPGSGTDYITPTGKHDVFISRYDTAGVYKWTKTFGGPTGDDMPESFTTDKSGNFYIVGYFYGNADFNPSTTVSTNMSSVGSWDVFINALRNDGSYLWSKRFGAGLFDTGNGIVTDWKGESIYTTGGFQDSPDFDTETPVYLFGSAGVNDVFIHKISQFNVGISESGVEPFTFNMYPNPANSAINIVIDSKNINSIFLIYDAVGKVVSSGKLISETTTVSVESLASGLYFFQLNGASTSQTFKLIKN